MKLAAVERTVGFLLHPEFRGVGLRVVPGMLLSPARGGLTGLGPEGDLQLCDVYVVTQL